MDITFPCPACGKQFAAEDRFAGRRTKCTGCGAGLLVPDRPAAAPAAEGPPAPAPPPDRSPCPKCGELVRVGAILCFKCKARLDGGSPAPEPAKSLPPAQRPTVVRARSKTNLLMWGIIGVAGALILVCCGGFTILRVFVGEVREMEAVRGCRENLRKIDGRLKVLDGTEDPDAPWRNLTGGAFLRETLGKDAADSRACPSPRGRSERQGLGYRGPRTPWSKMAPKDVVACDEADNHPGRLNVLYRSGELREVEKSDAEYSKALQATEP